MGVTFFTGGAAWTARQWPANNRAVYVPIVIPSYFTIARFMVANGTNATGNVDVGLYSFTGTRLISTGTTSRGALTSQVQYIGVTDQTFPAGRYYLALVASSTTGNYFSIGGVGVVSAQAGGWLQEDLGSTVLPTTMTPATYANGTFFGFGFTQSDTL